MTDELKIALALVEQVKPVLAGHPAGAQGAALCNLLALWLAGHAPELREGLLALHIDMTKHMVPVAEHELFGDAGHPASRVA